MTEGTPTDHSADHAASRRTVLMCAGLACAGGAAVLLSACSTAAVPYDANDAGQAPGPDLAVTSSAAAAATNPPAAADGSASAAAKPAGGGAAGTVLGRTADIPVGGGMVFTAGRREGLHRRQGRGHPAEQGRLQGVQRRLHARRLPVQPGRERDD